MSPFCVKVHLAMRLKGMDFEEVSTFLPRRYSPSGKVPYLLWDGEAIADSTVIVRAVEERCEGGPALIPEDPVQAADAHVLEDWADESLFWFLVFARYHDDEGWELYRSHLAATMPPVLRPLGPSVARRRMSGKLRAHGLLSRSRARILSEFSEHMAALATRLADRPYLVGESITMADISVVSVLWMLTVGVTPEFSRRMEAHPMLMEYIARVRGAASL